MTVSQVEALIGAKPESTDNTSVSGLTDQCIYYGVLSSKGSYQFCFSNGALNEKSSY